MWMGIGRELSEKARRRRHRVEDGFEVSSESVIFTEKGNQDTEIYKGGEATVQSLELSREH